MAGDIAAGNTYVVYYDGINFVLMSLAGGGGGGGDTRDYIYIVDSKASATDGGTFLTAAWRTRDLNTEKSDPGGHASVAANQITLAAGTYEIFCSAPAFNVNRHVLRLRNITDGTTDLTGQNAFASAGNSEQSYAFLHGRIVIAAQKTFELQHQCQTTVNDVGFGNDIGSDFAIDEEIYAIFQAYRVS